MDLIHMSIMGGILIILITVFRVLAIQKLPKRTFLILWGVVLLRLLLPIYLPTHLIIGSKNFSFVDFNIISKAEHSTFAVTGGQQMNEFSFNYLSVPILVWTIGFLFLSIYFYSKFIRSQRFLNEALPILDHKEIDEWLVKHPLKRKIKVLTSDRIRSPITYGVIHPKIVLPKLFVKQNNKFMEFVLLHEWIHIRHFHVVWKVVSLLALCIHWFNPFVWLMFMLLNRDIEIYCDEVVLHKQGEEKRQEYAYSLLDFLEYRNNLSVNYYAFGKRIIKERIELIMRRKKYCCFGSVLAIVVVISSISVFATNPVQLSYQKQYPEFYEALGDGTIDMKDEYKQTYYNQNNEIGSEYKKVIDIFYHENATHQLSKLTITDDFLYILTSTEIP